MDQRSTKQQLSTRTGVRRSQMLSLKEVHHEVPELSVATLRRMVRNGQLRGHILGSGRGRFFVSVHELTRLQLMMIDTRPPPRVQSRS